MTEVTSRGSRLPAEVALAQLQAENARLMEEAATRQRWSDALAEIATALLSGENTDILGLIADRAATLIGAAFVSIITPQPRSAQFVVRAAHGEGLAWLEGYVLEPGGTLAPTAMAGRASVVLEDIGELRGFGPIGPIVMMPLLASHHAIGAISVARRPGSAPFLPSELAMVSEFGQQASVAMELARAKVDSRKLEIVEERNRIARDLHDHVIQRLFAAGLTLSRTALETSDTRAAQAVNDQVDSIDAAIADIRTAVFALRIRPVGEGDLLRQRIMAIMSEFSPSMAEPPRLTTSGPIDLLIADELGNEVVAVVRELLSNVVQHAHAQRCNVDLTLSNESLTVTVTDDGRGFNAPRHRSGLKNIEERAIRLSGQFEISDGGVRGTIARWIVPMRRDAVADD